jgi:SAM-dependent methyltransferase
MRKVTKYNSLKSMPSALKNWEKIYLDNKHLSIWPWSDVVSYVTRYCKPKKNFNKILELGCGAGANIPFFLENNYNYFGIDGSKTIISKLKKKYFKIRNNFFRGDITSKIPKIGGGGGGCSMLFSIEQQCPVIIRKIF